MLSARRRKLPRHKESADRGWATRADNVRRALSRSDTPEQPADRERVRSPAQATGPQWKLDAGRATGRSDSCRDHAAAGAQQVPIRHWVSRARGNTEKLNASEVTTRTMFMSHLRGVRMRVVRTTIRTFERVKASMPQERERPVQKKQQTGRDYAHRSSDSYALLSPTVRIIVRRSPQSQQATRHSPKIHDQGASVRPLW